MDTNDSNTTSTQEVNLTEHHKLFDAFKARWRELEQKFETAIADGEAKAKEILEKIGAHIESGKQKAEELIEKIEKL